MCTMLLQDAERSRDIKEKAAEKHIPEFSFRPDIGPATYRHVETDPEQFVQRLYDYRLKQQENAEKLKLQIYSRDDERHCKVLNLNPKDVDIFLER